MWGDSKSASKNQSILDNKKYFEPIYKKFWKILGLINDVNPLLLKTSFVAPGRKYNAARDATGLSIAKQILGERFSESRIL